MQAVHPLNVNTVKFQIICCKDKILSSCWFKNLVKWSSNTFLPILTYINRFNCIMFQHDRLLVSDRPATSTVGNPATRWIFEQWWMLESFEYISDLPTHSRPSLRKQQGGPVFVALGGALRFCVLSWDERRLSMQVDFFIRRHRNFVVITCYK